VRDSYNFSRWGAGFPASVALFVSTALARAGEWSLTEAQKALRKNFHCGSEDGSGPFTLEATLSLASLELKEIGLEN